MFDGGELSEQGCVVHQAVKAPPTIFDGRCDGVEVPGDSALEIERCDQRRRNWSAIVAPQRFDLGMDGLELAQVASEQDDLGAALRAFEGERTADPCGGAGDADHASGQLIGV